jgi:hypothetical protein
MSSPYASDMLPMLPAAAVTPEAARARPAARHGLARGGITLQPGMASFLGRARRMPGSPQQSPPLRPKAGASH